MFSIGEPGRTPYDLNFSVFGFPVRVSAFFWLAAVVFGQGAASDGIPALLAWVAAMFMSILVHELGHTLAFRHFGISSHIVLYHMGGLAIPDSQRAAWSSTMRNNDPKSDIMISAAGPGLEILSAILLILVMNLAGYNAPRIPLLAGLLPQQAGAMIPNKFVADFVFFYCFVSVYWGLLNLLPVQPLDGGKIAQSLLRIFGNPVTAVPYSLILSIGMSILIAVYALQNDMTFLAIMFGFLGYSSFQQLQMYQSPGRW